MDPFLITGPTCISFSGGRTSAYMLWMGHCKRTGGKQENKCLYFFKWSKNDFGKSS